MTAAFRRRRASRRLPYGLGVLLVIALVAVFMPAKSGANVSGSPSSFETNDGNMTVDVSGNTDWNCLLGHGAVSDPAGKTCKTGLSTANLVVQHPGQTEGSGEFGWKPGQKLDAGCPSLITKASVPNKDDFTDIAQYNDQDTSTPPNTYIYGAEIRATANGSSSGNLELNQKQDPNGTCQIFRTAGDRLIAFDFQGGGTTLAFHALTWITAANPTAGGNNGTCDISNDSPPCWGANVLTSGPPENLTIGGCGSTTANDVEGCSNQSAISAADNGLSSPNAALAINQFAEFGVNITKALNLTGCFPITQEVWESRSSGSSFTSNPEDIEILNHEINNCGEIKIIKHTDPRGQNQSFAYTTTGGLTPSTFNLNDSAGVDTSTSANIQDYSAVPAGTYGVTETALNGYTLESLTCSADTASGSTATPSTATATPTASISLKANGTVICTYVNQPNTAGLTTAVSTSVSVPPGTAVHDTATITGNQTALTPTGTVSFYLCGPAPTGSCNSTTTSAGSGTLSGSLGVATADSSDVNTSASPLAPGRYCFEATWPGDTNYPGTLTENGGASATDNECFTVTSISTTTMTSPSLGTGDITFGSQVTDHALVTAAADGGGTPTGTVAFYICTPTEVTNNGGTCSATAGSQVGTSGVATTVSNPVTDPPSSTADSAAITANITGTWCFAAVYTPGPPNGAFYTGSNDATSDECFTVQDTSSASSTQSWVPNDTGNVSSGNGAPLTGTLSIQMYTGDNCGVTSGSAVSGKLYTKSLTGTGSTASLTTSNTTAVSASASVSWLVTFTSSDPNVGNSSHCESSTLTISN